MFLMKFLDDSASLCLEKLKKHIFLIFTKFYLKKCCFSSSRQNHAESSGNFVKNLILNLKHAKFDQKSEIGHVRAAGGRSAAVGGGRRLSAGGRRRSAAVGRRSVGGDGRGAKSSKVGSSSPTARF